SNYAITVSLGSNPNYNVTPTIGTLTIGAKTAAVMAHNKSNVYVHDNPVLDAAVAGTINGDALNYTLATTAAKFSNVGDYPIAVRSEERRVGKESSSNGTPTIKKKKASVTATNNTNTYEDDNSSFESL